MGWMGQLTNGKRNPLTDCHSEERRISSPQRVLPAYLSLKVSQSLSKHFEFDVFSRGDLAPLHCNE